MRLKQGVSAAGVKPEIVLACFIVDKVYVSYGYECVVTSLLDGVHSKHSRHYLGLAADFRIRHLVALDVEDVFESIQNNLGDQYYVRLESNHIHVGYKPTKGSG